MSGIIRTLLGPAHCSPVWYPALQVLYHLGIHLSKCVFFGDFAGAGVHRDQEITGLREGHDDLIHLTAGGRDMRVRAVCPDVSTLCLQGNVLTVMKELLSPLCCSGMLRDLTCVWRWDIHGSLENTSWGNTSQVLLVDARWFSRPDIAAQTCLAPQSLQASGSSAGIGTAAVGGFEYLG